MTCLSENLEVLLPDVLILTLFFIFALCANRRKRSEISRRRQLEVCLPDVVVFLFLLEETVQIGGKEVNLSPTSTGSPSTRRSVFLLEETVQISGKSEISRQRQLEVRLPDVMAIFLFLLEESANRPNKSDLSLQHQLEVCLPDVNWKSVYPTSWPFSYFCSRNLQIGQTKNDLSCQHQLEVCLPDVNWKSVYQTLAWSPSTRHYYILNANRINNIRLSPSSS